MRFLSANAQVRPGLFLKAAATLALLFALFWDGIGDLISQWQRAEFSHSFLIPLVAAIIAAQCWERTPVFDPKGRWFGAVLVAGAMLLVLLGELSTLFQLIEIGLVLCVVGLTLAAVGWGGLKVLAPALIYLAFMLPVPEYFLVNISVALQLLSTKIGVALIRLFSIPVFADGNVIDLGNYKLQVAEACSGLRYLFPLMSFGFLIGYLYRGPFWQRAVIFLSTIPITILMNSLRIGVVGITVDRWGSEAAEEFIHLFEGWVVFLCCLTVLLAEVALLLRLGGPGGRLRDALEIELPRLSNLKLGGSAPASANIALVICAILMTATLAGTALLERRVEAPPRHRSFALFPMRVGAWSGQTTALEPDILNRLKLDDYLHADYADKTSGDDVSLYIAYYQSQRKGESLHSPHNCLPTNGWDIANVGLRTMDAVGPGGTPLQVNRALIRKGDITMVAYYWFEERGRVVTTAPAAKWYLLVDSLTKHRTDGALVRIVTPLDKGEDEDKADARIAAFARLLRPVLADYVPD
jgi:exosortase D (VPLPA-CTERM-specific)